MNSSRLFVFKLKEVICTILLIVLAIVAIIVLIIKLGSGNKSSDSNSAQNVSYNPGVYTTQLSLGDTALNIQVTVDETIVKDIAVVNLNESITTMYPLIEPSVSSIESQLQEGVSIDKVTISDDSKYTQSLIIQCVKDCLTKAQQ